MLYAVCIWLGEPYYFNIYTCKSQWHRPTKPAAPVTSSMTSSEESESLKRRHSSEGEREKESKKPESKIQCSHILVKHKDSRRPSSWRTEKITRTKEDALELIKGT